MFYCFYKLYIIIDLCSTPVGCISIDNSNLLGPEDGQAIWSILHCSLSQKFDYHLSLCYPSDIKNAAMKLDTILWDLVSAIERPPINPRFIKTAFAWNGNK